MCLRKNTVFPFLISRWDQSVDRFRPSNPCWWEIRVLTACLFVLDNKQRFNDQARNIATKKRCPILTLQPLELIPTEHFCRCRLVSVGIHFTDVIHSRKILSIKIDVILTKNISVRRFSSRFDLDDSIVPTWDGEICRRNKIFAIVRFPSLKLQSFFRKNYLFETNHLNNISLISLFVINENMLLEN